jgi:hypothetical protein
MARYSHMFDVAFSLESEREDGSDVTPAMLKAALLKRIDALDETLNQGEWHEACGLVDTYEVTS